MKKQLLILTTTLLLTTSSYAFNNNGEACDRNNHKQWSQNQHYMQNHANKNHRFEERNMNNTDKNITLEEFIALKEAKFSQMDLNSDGILTQDEMRNHRKNRHHKPMRGGMF